MLESIVITCKIKEFIYVIARNARKRREKGKS